MVDTGFVGQLFERVGFFDERRMVQQLLHLGAIDDIAMPIVGVGNVDFRQHRRIGDGPGVRRVLCEERGRRRSAAGE